jgi:hypothetical protein
MLEVERIRLSKDAIQEPQHLVVGVGTTAEQDDPRSSGSVDREKSRVIEIRGHDDLPSCTCDSQDLGVSGALRPMLAAWTA